MRPRSKLVGSARCSSVGEVGRRTSAPEGAVRPQPKSSEEEGTARMAAGSGGVDGTGVNDCPDRASGEKGAVGKYEILWFSTLALFKQECVAKDRDGERNDRQLEKH